MQRPGAFLFWLDQNAPIAFDSRERNRERSVFSAVLWMRLFVPYCKEEGTMTQLARRRQSKSLRRIFGRDPIQRLRDDLEQLFSKFSFDLDGHPLAEMHPSLDVSETDKTIELKMDIPGLQPGDFDIELSDNLITISGERKVEETREERPFHVVERRYGSFSRTVTLPCAVEHKDVNATYKDGVLEVSLTKVPGAQTKKITVQG
jgi:HSP20 family protein